MQPQSFSLFQLNEHFRRVVALNFPESIWVSAEIAQVNESRGHYYFNLIEKDSEASTIIAESQAVLWQRDYRRLRRRLGKAMGSLMQNGIAILVKVRIEFHERYGLKLMIEDIDPAYTVGQLEIQKRKTIEALQSAGLFSLNKDKKLPLVLQKIAVISSPTAAGYQDYLQQLNENRFGYKFHNTLFPAAVQGERAVPEMINQLEKIALSSDRYDAVVMIRGGGAKLDLMAFDQFDLCEEVANCPIPVIVGVGHEVDETVIDLVAHSSLKTPTAVAAFIIQNNLEYESELVQIGQWIQDAVQLTLQEQDQQLIEWQQFLTIQAKHLITQNDRMLTYMEEEIPRQISRQINLHDRELSTLENIVNILDPKTVMERGYAFIEKNNTIVHSANSLSSGDEIIAHFKDGAVKGKVD